MMKNKLALLTVLLAIGIVSCQDPTTKNAPPSLGIGVPTENTVVGTAVAVNLDGPTDPDNDAIDKIEYNIDGSAFTALSKTDQGQTFFLSGLSEGEHTVTVKATDKQKNTSTPVARKFRVDGTIPVIDPIAVDGVATPPATVQKAKDAVVSIFVSAIDKLSATDATNGGTSTLQLRLSVDGTPVKAVTGGALSYSTKDLTVGSHVLVAQAVDRAGNVAFVRSQGITIVEAAAVDTTAPEISILTPTADGEAFAPGATLTVVINANDKESGIAASKVLLAGIAMTSSDGISYTATLPNTEGTKAITASTKNNTGLSSAVVSRTIKVDGTPPVVSFSVTPQTQDRIERVIEGTAVDALAGTDNVSISIQQLDALNAPVGAPIQANVAPTALTGAFSYKWNPGGLPYAKYRVSVSASDKLGNTTPTAVAQIATLKDQTKPEISLLSPGASSTFAKDVPLSALVSDNADDVNAGVTSLSFLVDGQSTPIVGTVDPANSKRFFATASISAAGTYKVRAQATDAAGNLGQSTETSFTINNAAPTVTFVAPTTNVIRTTTKFRATATSSSAISNVAFSDGTGALGVPDTTVPYEADFDVTTRADGVYTITAAATDANGFVGQNTFSVTLDKTSPNASFGTISPASGANLEKGIITVGGLGNDGLSGLSRLELYAGVNGAAPSLYATQTVTGASASTSFTYSTTGLAYGNTVVLELRAVDLAGNVTAPGSVQSPFTIKDLTLPTGLTFTAPVLDTLSTNTNIVATAQDNTGITGIRFFVDGILALDDTTAPYEFLWSLAGVANGPHTITSEARDAAGNVTTLNKVFTVAKDATAPTLTMNPQTTATNGYYKGGSILEFSWLGVDPTPSSGFNNVTFTPSAGTVAVTPTPTGITSDFGLWTLPTSSGSVNLKGIASDLNGNNSNPVFINVNVDNDAPVLNFTNITNNQEFTSSPISLGYIASDALSGVRQVELRENGVLVSVSTSATGAFSWSPSTGNGIYSLEIKATDNVGNATTPITVTGIKVNVPVPDTTPPTVSVNQPLPNPGTGSIVISVAANDSSGVSSVTLLVDGTPVGTDTVSPYSFNVDTTKYNNGSVPVQARATDTRGNTSSDTAPIPLTIQNDRLPELSITSPLNAATLSGNNPITISLVKKGTDYTFASNVVVDVLDYRGTIVATRTIAASGVGPANFVQSTSAIDFNSFPIDAYTIRAKVSVDLDPVGAPISELQTSVSISNNNSSNQPPAIVIQNPIRINELQTTLPIFRQPFGFVVAQLSDDSGLHSVELRATCDTCASGSGPINALEQYISLNGSSANVALRFDADGTPYLPDGNYTLRVVAQDTAGNRNIQEVKVTISRDLLYVKLPYSVIPGPDSLSFSPGSGSCTVTGLVLTKRYRVASWFIDPSGKYSFRDDSVTNATSVGISSTFNQEGNWLCFSQVTNVTDARVDWVEGGFTVVKK